MRNKILVLVSIFCLSIACSCEDKLIEIVPEIQFYYINNSNYVVNISAITPRLHNTSIIDSIIEIGDTIRYSNYKVGNTFDGPFGSPDSSSTVKITFISTVNRCLLFAGPVSNESTDIRSQKAYEASEFKAVQKHYYKITNDQYAIAVLCE